MQLLRSQIDSLALGEERLMTSNYFAIGEFFLLLNQRSVFAGSKSAAEERQMNVVKM